MGNALAHFRGLPLRPVNGATVSDYYGGSATVGVAAGRPSRVYDFETFSVFRCPVLYLYTKLIVCGPLERAFHHSSLRDVLLHATTPHAHSSVVASGMVRRVRHTTTENLGSLFTHHAHRTRRA